MASSRSGTRGRTTDGGSCSSGSKGSFAAFPTHRAIETGSGWSVYKKIFSFERAQLAAGSEHPFQFIVTQMHHALQLSSRMERIVGAVMAGARLKLGSFGCVHARVENDTKGWDRLQDGKMARLPIPSANDYMAWADSARERNRGQRELPTVVSHAPSCQNACLHP